MNAPLLPASPPASDRLPLIPVMPEEPVLPLSVVIDHTEVGRIAGAEILGQPAQ